MAGAAGAVGVERARVGRRLRARRPRGPPRCARRGASGRARGTDPACACAKCRESRCRTIAVPVVLDGEGVAPEPEREPERDGRDRDRVQALARRVLVLPGHADHDRVERPLERRRAARDPAEERLGVRDGRRSGERGDGGQLAAEILQQPAPDPRGQQREAAQRRARHLRERVVLVRIAAESGRSGAAGSSTSEVADHGNAARRAPARARPPAASRARPRSRAASTAVAPRSVSGPQAAEQRAGAAVKDGLGGRDAEDEVGLEQQRVDAQRRPSGIADVDEVGRLGVVHLDPAVEAAARTTARAALRARGCPALRLSPPATRIVWRVVGHAEPLQLVDRGGERVPGAGRRARPAGEAPAPRRRASRVPPRETSASSGEPESGKRSASRTAAATSTMPSEGRRGRSTTPSRTFTTATREPDGIGTRGTTAMWPTYQRGGMCSVGSRAAARSARRAGSSTRQSVTIDVVAGSRAQAKRAR